MSYCVEQRPTGRGNWRFNPILLKNENFCTELHPNPHTCGDLQTQWEKVKKKKRTKKLQSQRNSVLRNNPTLAERESTLPPIQNEIIQLRQDLVDTAKLRSVLWWREKDKLSTVYLNRIITTRGKKQNIEDLVHPTTGNIFSNDEDKLQATAIFYKDLFVPELVENDTIQQLAKTITFTQQLTSPQQQSLSRPFSFDSIREQARRSSNPSSPGLDDLSYGIILFIFNLPLYGDLVHKLYNTPLEKGIFPLFVMCLIIPKKGNLILFQNWRPFI